MYVPLKMLRHHGLNVPGETAGFTAEHARVLLAKGFAEKTEGTDEALATLEAAKDAAAKGKDGAAEKGKGATAK